MTTTTRVANSQVNLPLFPIERTEKPPKSFEHDAYGHAKSFAKKTRGEPFSPEQVVMSASSIGIIPHDLRSWGAVFLALQRDGFIKRSKELFPRVTSNGALRPGWQSV